MVAEPTQLEGRERRQVEAVVVDDWTLCGACNYSFGFKIAGLAADSRVKCPNGRCGVWVRLAPRLRESVSRRV